MKKSGVRSQALILFVLSSLAGLHVSAQLTGAAVGGPVSQNGTSFRVLNQYLPTTTPSTVRPQIKERPTGDINATAATQNKILFGGANGGGGDTLFCRPTSPQLSEFSGYFSLDYLATYKKANKNADIVNVKSWQDSVQRIRSNLLRLKAYNLTGTFDRFTKNIGNDTDYSSGLIWKEAGYGLEDIKDEELIHKLPPNCLSSKEDGTSVFIQTVYWKSYKGFRIYNYDFDVINALEKSSPLQLSFLYVHEWLWTHLKHPDSIRVLNRLIHSERFDTISIEEFNTITHSLEMLYPATLSESLFQATDGSKNTISYDLTNTRGLATPVVFIFSLLDLQINVGYQFRCDYDPVGEQTCKPAYETSSHETVNHIKLRVIDFSTIGLTYRENPERIFKLQKTQNN